MLHTHDRYGHRVDRVEYHPAYHELMRVAIANGLRGAVGADAGPGAHVARAAKMIVWSQVDAGHVPDIDDVLGRAGAPATSLRWPPNGNPRLLSTTYDPSFAPVADKAGVTGGMGMTEKQGGSDIRANTARAEPDPAGGGGVPPDRPQVVLLGAHERRLPDARPDRRGADVLPGARWLPDRTPACSVSA